MGAQKFVFYCFFIASSNAFPLLPWFLDPTSATIQNNEAYEYDMLKLQSKIPTICDKTGDNFLLKPSMEENSSEAEPASALLSHLKSMLDSPYEEAKKYASEKTKELVSNLERNTNKVIRFTLGGVDLLVDLGTRGSPTRLRNVEQGNSVMNYVGGVYKQLASWVSNWFVAERNIEIVNKDRIKTEKENSTNPKFSDNSLHPKDGKHLASRTTAEGDLAKSKFVADYKNSELDDQKDSNPQEGPKNRHKKEPILKSTSTEIFIPPKELSVEEKVDVERAHQRILIIEKNIHQFEDETMQHIDDDEKLRLKRLRNQAQILKKFIKISTSESI